MLLVEAEWVFMGFILHISGVQGREISICAPKGSSVSLPCSAQHPTSKFSWYTVNSNGSTFVLNELSADGYDTTYNMTEGGNFALTINDVRESDAKFYCCTETTDNPELCWESRAELHVADLQVKVIPATEGQTVMLTCSTSCPLTEKPAAYIWYKNRELLYEDWSPWYQELVSSDKAVRYSCAIKGYEGVGAPEVSVDSVTPTCFSVTYAKGRMCSYQLTSVDEPCSITYPTDLRVQRTSVSQKSYDTLTCNTSCPMADPHTAFKWYWSGELHNCESQDITLFSSSPETFSCAVKSNEYLRSDETCVNAARCGSGNYASRRICALEDSSVNISVNYSHPGFYKTTSPTWYQIKRSDEEDDCAEVLVKVGRVEYRDNVQHHHHILKINDLKRNDSAEYTFTTQKYDKCDRSDLPGVMLVVTGLKVTMTPSAEVTEGQRVTLTCSTSCPLPGNTNYIWYLNSRPLTLRQNHSKHLVLDPVSSLHAGNYSCAVETPQNISSPEEALTVKARGLSVVILNTVKLVVLVLFPPAVFLLYVTMRKKRTVTATAEQRDQVRPGQMDSLYESVALMTMNPAAKREAAEQQEDTV